MAQHLPPKTEQVRCCQPHGVPSRLLPSCPRVPFEKVAREDAPTALLNKLVQTSSREPARDSAKGPASRGGVHCTHGVLTDWHPFNSVLSTDESRVASENVRR